MTQEHNYPENASKRHWMYGANAVILVIVAVIIVAFVMIITASNYAKGAKWDLTANGAYSLSGYTQQLLKRLDEKKEKYELVNVFRPSDDRQQQVQDILDEYARSSNNITVSDLSQVTRDQVVEKIRSRYTGEIKPYEDAIAEYRKVAGDLEKFSKTEAANAGAVAQQPGANEQTQKDAAQLQGLFGDIMPQLLSETRRDVNRYTDNTTPDYSAAVNSIKTNFGQVVKQLQLLSNQQQVKELLAPAVVKYLADESKPYNDMLKELQTYTDKLDKLAPLKVGEILGSLAPGTVVVIGPTSAAVVPEASIYKAPAGAESQDTRPTFQGEQAISSALLPMIEPNKVKVVFVTSTSQTHPTTSTSEEGWSDMCDRLRSANFDVLEWSPPGPPQGPDQPPSSPTPPAEGKGVVWVIFPPDPPNPQMMMMGMPPPNPQPVIDAVKKHLDEGGQALFLADAVSGPSMMMGPADYPYNDLLKPFGIDVQAKYTVVHNYPGPGGERRVFPQISVSKYGDHEITKPLQALQTTFVGFSSRQMGGFFGAPTVVDVAKFVPAGVNAQVIVESSDDADTWAEATFSQTAEFNKATDRGPPVPLAAASVKNAGKDNEQRMVVLASRTVGSNTVIDAINARESGSGGAELYLVNPGNAELINNSVLWLAGYKNMIAVSAKAGAAGRIKAIPTTMLAFIRTMVFAGLPLIALLIGGVVYFFRRR